MLFWGGDIFMLFSLDTTVSSIGDVPCGGAGVLRVIKFAMLLIDIACILIPILLVLMISFSFFKNVIAKNVEDMQKEVGIVVKKLIMCATMFLVPTIVKVVITLLGSLGVNYAECIDIARNEDLSQYEVVFPEIENNTTTDLSNGTTVVVPGNDKDSETVSSNKKTDLNIFIGDSRCIGMRDTVGQNENDHWICGNGQGYTWLVSTAIPSLKNTVKKGEKYNIFLNLGVNDLSNMNSYAKKYAELVSDFQDSNIIIVSVNPVDEVKENEKRTYTIKNSDIESFNKTMKEKAIDTSGLIYCDTYSKIKSDLGTWDGLHYTGTTYQKIYEEMKKCT